MRSRSVNTTIPTEYHKRAVLSDVKWTEALCIGIDILTGVNFYDEKKLKDEIRLETNKVRLKIRQLNKLKEKRIEKEKFEAETKEKEKNSCPICKEEYSEKNKKKTINGKSFCRNCFLSGEFQK